VRMEEGNNAAVGRGADPDILVASAKAYINAMNRLAKKPMEIAKTVKTALQ
jgi:2-isopropylmalate synthase (EC 2.3.3.13)